MSGSQDSLRQRNGVEARPLPRGALLVDMNTGQCFRLNRVGAEIWTMLTSPTTASEVSARIATRYGKPVAQIDLEVRALLELLVREQLVEVATEASARVP
jgi:hypothetical protein